MALKDRFQDTVKTTETVMKCLKYFREEILDFKNSHNLKVESYVLFGGNF